MRTSHLALLAAASIAVLLALWLAFGGGARVLAADPAGEGGQIDGVGPGGDLARSAAGSEESAATLPTRSAIASAEPVAAATKIAARKKARVSGRVVDGRGQGLSGARVWITTSEFWAPIPLDLELEALPARWIQVERTECDAEGRFVFEDLKPGRLRLAARATSFAPAYREDLGLLREHDAALGDKALGDIALTPGVVVAGSVLGPDGKPAPGVRVLIAAGSLMRGGAIDVPGRGVPAGTTDAQGSFRVDELAAGPFHLLFLAEGFALAELAGRIERAGETQDGFVVRLDFGVEIAGRIRAESGALPAELRVVARRSAQPETDARGGDVDETVREETTEFEARPRSASVGADATFRIAGLRAGESYRLSLGQKRGEAWRAAGSTVARDQHAPAAGIEIVYKPETAILARVVDDATSLPIEELVVWAGIGRMRALTDDKNEVQRSFPLGHVRYGELRVQPSSKPAWLRISAPGYEDFERKDLVLAAGIELDLGDVRLKPERRIVVTVVDTAGNPIEKARVIVTTEKLEILRSWSRQPVSQDLWAATNARFARTGADGVATLTSDPGKNVLVQASARGLVPSEALPLLLPKDADHALTLTLGRGSSVLVRVRDGAGRAVVGVPIGHRLPRESGDGDEDQQAESVITDALGEARFEALEMGLHAFRVEQEDGESAWWEEDGNAEGREEPWQEITVTDGAEVVLALVAPPRGTLLGVVREGGRPLEGALVKLVPYVEGRDAGWTWAGGGRDPFSTSTDHRGEYRIENRRAGEYVVLVHHAERRMPTEFRLVLGSGEQVQDFALDLNAVEGRVTDPEGRPLSGVRIAVSRAEAGIEMNPPQALVLQEDDRGNPNLRWREGRGNREARTDAQGRFVLRGLVENTGLHVHCQGDEVELKSSDPITLAPGEIRRGVDFVLRRAGRIRVEIAGTLPENQWFEASVVQRTGEQESVVRQVWLSHWDRNETVGSIVPGVYAVRLFQRHPEGRSTPIAELSAEVEVGKVVGVTFQVP